MAKINFDLLYQLGIIGSWYLRTGQQDFYQALRKHKKIVAKCHRRYGKGTTAFSYIFERAMTEKIIIRYGAPTQKDANEIFEFLMNKIYENGPEYKPKYNGRMHCWYWSYTNSQLFVFGAKDREELDKARGKESHIILCDEFAFWRYKPRYYLDSVLSPQLDNTNGQMIITSTPPDDLTHPYIEECAAAQVNGTLFERDILQSVRLGDVDKTRHDRIVERCGGVESDAYRREYLCLLVAAAARLVVPEAQDVSLFTGRQPRPTHFKSLAVFDLGFVDYFAGVFGYVDFKTATLVIEREVWVHYAATSQIVEQCRAVESDLGYKPDRRLGDCSDQQQLYDLGHDHDYQVSPIVKRSKQSNCGFRDSVINGLRVAVKSGKILVDAENCPNLCAQLMYGSWNDQRSDFMRSEKMGHLDLLVALAYALDNADFATNPYPAYSADTRSETHFISADAQKVISGVGQLAKLKKG